MVQIEPTLERGAGEKGGAGALSKNVSEVSVTLTSAFGRMQKKIRKTGITCHSRHYYDSKLLKG